MDHFVCSGHCYVVFVQPWFVKYLRLNQDELGILIWW